MSKLTAKIIETFEKDAWEFGTFRAKHPSGWEIWIGNGMMFCKLREPIEMDFNLWNKWKIWKAITDSRDRVLVKVLEDKPNEK